MRVASAAAGTATQRTIRPVATVTAERDATFGVRKPVATAAARSAGFRAATTGATPTADGGTAPRVVGVTASTTGTARPAAGATRAARAADDGGDDRACRTTTRAARAAVAGPAGSCAITADAAATPANGQAIRETTRAARPAVRLPGTGIVGVTAHAPDAGVPKTCVGPGGHASGSALTAEDVAGAARRSDTRTARTPVAGLSASSCDAASATGATERIARARGSRSTATTACTAGQTVGASPAGAPGTANRRTDSGRVCSAASTTAPRGATRATRTTRTTCTTACISGCRARRSLASAPPGPTIAGSSGRAVATGATGTADGIAGGAGDKCRASCPTGTPIAARSDGCTTGAARTGFGESNRVLVKRHTAGPAGPAGTGFSDASGTARPACHIAGAGIRIPISPGTTSTTADSIAAGAASTRCRLSCTIALIGATTDTPSAAHASRTVTAPTTCPAECIGAIATRKSTCPAGTAVPQIGISASPTGSACCTRPGIDSVEQKSPSSTGATSSSVTCTAVAPSAARTTHRARA